MASSALIVVIIGLFYLHLATAAITHCYSCVSPNQPECDDPFNTTLHTPAQCDIMSSKALQPLLGDFAVNERINNKLTEEYFCLKLGVDLKTGESGILRTCYSWVDVAGDLCTILKAAIILEDATVSEVTKCSTCNDVNGCNSAGSICASVVMIFIAMLLAKSY